MRLNQQWYQVKRTFYLLASLATLQCFSLALSFVGISSVSPAFTAERPPSPPLEPPQSLLRAGVSVVRLLVTYQKKDAADAELVYCTGLGTLIASWSGQNDNDQNSWILTDSSLVNTYQALCANEHPQATLLSIKVYLSTAYNQQGANFRGSTGTVICQDKDCHSGPALFALGQTHGQLLPFLDLAQQQSDPHQEMAIKLTANAELSSASPTSSAASLPLASITTTNALETSGFQTQAEQFLTPSQASLTSPLEAGTPLINANGQLTSLTLKGASDTQTPSTLQSFIKQNIPGFSSHAANPVHDGWQHGIDAYVRNDYSKAQREFQAAAEANPSFQAAKDLAVPSLSLKKKTTSSQFMLLNTITIAGVSIALWQFVVGILLLLGVVLVVIALLLGRSRRRSLKADLLEAYRQATIEAPQITEMEMAREHDRVKKVKELNNVEHAEMQPLSYEQPRQQKSLLIPVQRTVAQLPCPRCGELVSREAKSCSNCHLQLSPSGPHLSPPMTPEIVTRPLFPPVLVPEQPMGSPTPVSFVTSEQAKPRELKTPPSKNERLGEPPSRKSAAEGPQPDDLGERRSQPRNRRLGNYRLIRLLGKGGFADVYLGEHVLLDMPAAIKLLQLHLTKERIKDFLAEARTIARLVHPHIIRVLEFDVDSEEPDQEQSILYLEGSTPFLVMDYAPGGSLRQRYPKGSRLALETVISYTGQVAEALEYAHQNKLIHRDVKPENMLIGSRDEILLSDFGIAVIAHSEHSMTTQQMAGTLPYMAPEQIRGKPQPASDQYSLGIVVYEWLTGNRPFQGSGPWEIMNQHFSSPPPSLRENNPSIPEEVEHVVLKALSKDPQHRFASIADFAKALANAHP